MPEQDEADTRSPSGEPPPENESSLAAQVESDALTSNDQDPLDESTPDENQSAGEMGDLPAPEPVDEWLLVAQDISLPEESQPVAVEPEPSRPEPRRLSRGERETVDRQRQRFTACGRCGYFIADCQNQLGVEALQTALLNAADGWVRLTVDRSFHRRVMDAYGVQLDAEFDLFDGTCPECRRRFVVENVDDGPTYLKLRV